MNTYYSKGKKYALCEENNFMVNDYEVFQLELI
jgi:hypothetical protein